MTAYKTLLLCFFIPFFCGSAQAQRNYKANSVLASGNWYKLAVSAEGVYKIDVPLLNSLGVTGNIPSGQIRLFGNGGAMLPEAGNSLPIDDLEENAIMINDGGDGILDGSDFILFYASGPHHWLKDSTNKRFVHQKNLYSEKSFYFLTIGGSGLRVPVQTTAPAPSTTVNSFNERYFHELDTVNFLASGREWYGEEFSNAPGKTLTRTFNLPLSDLQTQSATLITAASARSINATSRVNVSVNGQPVHFLDIAPVTTGIYDLFAREEKATTSFILNQTTASVTINYTPGSFNSQAWLNWFELHCRRSLVLPAGGQLAFRDWNSVGSGTVEFLISNADASTQVWDVTDPLRPVRMNATLAGNQLRFTNDAQRLREYICFSTSFLSPEPVGRVNNQNLHATVETDYFIVSWPAFRQQAERLATFHQQRGLRTLVVTTEEVFNEFASGSPDPTAIRDFVKMYYDKYNATWSQVPKSLLLVGRASYDYKDRISGNTNFVPAYESVSSLEPLSTYTSDDFFGFLDDHEDINSTVVINELDLGIGRIPAKTAEDVKNFIDKVMDYHSPESFGPWRNGLNFIADDEDYNVHLLDAEVLTATVATTNPVFNTQKIYLDAFQQESGSAGGRYPQANAMINSNIYNGTLIWNYSGHGGPQRLAEEVVIDQQIVNGWNNRFRLPLFITATCDFAPYDNPGVNALGEDLLVRPKTGAIALMTTTRVVFAFSNRVMNDNYLRFALQPDANGKYKNLGEAMRVAKNYTYQTFNDIVNNRKFVLLGDPAMTLGFPTLNVVATKVNGVDITTDTDTLSAMELVMLEGEVRDPSGSLISNFNGTAYLSVFDKIQTISTMANDATSIPVNFQTRENILFRGKASVQNGKFEFKFKVPKDINYQYGSGKVSLYAHDNTRDGNGFTEQVIVGGISSTADSDNEGPEIRVFLNDEKFVDGGIVNPSPVLLLKLFDTSGINTGGSGIDHDIVATLDNDNNQYFVLNNFYESDVNDYKRGTVRFQLPELSPGHHTLKIKAWDVMNNSNEATLSFTVVTNEKLKIDHVLNYPNPFTTRTAFWFEHNRPGMDLYVKLEIFTVSGKLIKTISQTINTPGNRSSEVEWDGRDDYGNKIGHGVYLYRLRVREAGGSSADKWERLVILGK